MKYLVTGGAGFIGSHLVEILLADEHQVVCIDDLSSGYFKNLPKNSNLEFINEQIQKVKNIDEDIDGIFHLAAQTSVPVSMENFFDSSSNNLLSMLKIWNLARIRKIPIVYASSSAIYGNLEYGDDTVNAYDIISPYALDKLTMEDYAKLLHNIFQIPSYGLRFFNVYGPRQDPSNSYSGVISIFIDRLIKKSPIVLNGGHQTRDFIFVTDVCEVLMRSMKSLMKKPSCDAFNVGTGQSSSINLLLVKLKNIFGYEPIVNKKKLPLGDPEKSGCKCSKLENFFDLQDYNFISLDAGLKETVKNMSKEH